MITVPTHKRHESPFKLSKTIYIFTSGQVIVTVQIHSRKTFKGVKMTTAKWTLIQEPSRIHAILLRDLMKRGVCRVEMPLLTQHFELLCYFSSVRINCPSSVFWALGTTRYLKFEPST
jgi:hypothetical protein